MILHQLGLDMFGYIYIYRVLEDLFPAIFLMVWEQPKLPKNWVAGEVPGCWSVTGPLPVIIMMIHLGFTGIYWYNLMLSWMLAFFFWLLRIFRAAWLHLPHLQFLAWFGPRKVHKICSFFLTNLHETSFWQIQIMISRYYTYFCQTDSFLDICGLCMIPHWHIFFVFSSSFWDFSGWKPLSKFPFISHPVNVDEAHGPPKTHSLDGSSSSFDDREQWPDAGAVFFFLQQILFELWPNIIHTYRCWY